MTKFKGNEAGNCDHVGIIYNMNKNGCYVGGHNSIYHAKEGISVHSAGTSTVGWELE